MELLSTRRVVPRAFRGVSDSFMDGQRIGTWKENPDGSALLTVAGTPYPTFMSSYNGRQFPSLDEGKEWLESLVQDPDIVQGLAGLRKTIAESKARQEEEERRCTWTGKYYDPIKSIKDVAKDIRAAIKIAVKEGLLPARDYRVSVKADSIVIRTIHSREAIESVLETICRDRNKSKADTHSYLPVESLAFNYRIEPEHPPESFINQWAEERGLKLMDIDWDEMLSGWKQKCGIPTA